MALDIFRTSGSKPLKSTIIELNTVSGTLSYPFGVQSVLDGKNVVYVTVPTAASLYSQGNIELLGPELYTKGYITLTNKENIQLLTSRIGDLANNGQVVDWNNVLPINLRGIDWQKSKVYFAAQPTASRVISVTVYYED